MKQGHLLDTHTHTHTHTLARTHTQVKILRDPDRPDPKGDPRGKSKVRHITRRER